MTRLPWLLLALALAAPAQPKNPPQEPLAEFSGVVRGSSPGSLTLEDAEGNTIQFDCSRKTRYYQGGTAIKREALRPGDHVIVEARRTYVERLEAVNVRRQ